MFDRRARRQGGDGGNDAGRGGVPGKRTLTQKLAPGPVQLRRAHEPGAQGEDAPARRVLDMGSLGEEHTPEADDDQVAVTVQWTGKFGAELSADVRIEGSHDGKTRWKHLATETVLDPTGPEGDASEALSVTIAVPRYAYYRAVLRPLAGRPEDRYRDSASAALRVEPTATSASITRELAVNRWNRKNVDDAWRERKIEPGRVGQTRPAELFGRIVQVHELVAPRVEKTNALFRALDARTQAEIKDSLFVTGGYAKRTTTQGSFSNHSVGLAIDVNYHLATKQNYHFKDTDMKLLRDLVQPVVRSEPGYGKFNISEDQGMRQLEASHIFNKRFPGYLARLLGRDDDAEAIDTTSYVLDILSFSVSPIRELRPESAATMGDSLGALRAATAKELFGSISKADLNAVIKAQKDQDKKKQLQLILKNWSVLEAWLFGVEVTDKVEKKQKRLVGMIPLRADVLQMFLDTGWQWGGNWDKEKDYMHFEDTDVLKMLQQKESPRHGRSGTR